MAASSDSASALRSPKRNAPASTEQTTPRSKARRAATTAAAIAAATPAAEVVYAEGSRKVSAEEVAAPFRAEIREAVEKLKAEGKSAPKLVGFLANKDPSARKYAEWTGKAFKADSLDFELCEVDESELEEQLIKANSDPTIDGVMVYFPVFGSRPSFHGGSQDAYLSDTVSAYKDVEGMGHYYRRALYRNQRKVDKEQKKKCVLPCTPLAVIKTLEHLAVYDNKLPTGDRMAGKNAVVMNRSEVVGRPLAAMMANDGATVYSMDVDSMYVFRRGKLEVPDKDVSKGWALQHADIVVLGVPSKEFDLDIRLIKENAVVINVSSFKNIQEKELLSKVKGVRYMAQVGKITVAMLERNLVQLHRNFHEEVAAGKSGEETII